MNHVEKYFKSSITVLCILIFFSVCWFLNNQTDMTDSTVTDREIKKASEEVKGNPGEELNALVTPAAIPNVQKADASMIPTQQPTVLPKKEKLIVKDEKKEIYEDKENETADKTVNSELPEKQSEDDEGVTIKTEENKNDDNRLFCTLSVKCDTLIGKAQKELVIPDDGIIFAEKKVEFYEDESVFNVLLREMKKNKIHLEYVSVPVYNSAYIEGINNIYEFDFGELSGWMYKVNGIYPNYGCSNYKLKKGDEIEWVYTCDLGRDVGGEYSARNGK